jgi:hypothetical protein
MRAFLISLAAAAAACAPPAVEPSDEAPAAPADAAVELDLGPYANNWDAAEFSRFRHTIHAAAPGTYLLTLQAQTDSPGGETVAVYPIGPDGNPRTARILFVVADRDGESRQERVDIPGEGLPVAVVVENAGGRRHAGNYMLTVDAAPAP